jgi:methylaspartate ammonia-lyase
LVEYLVLADIFLYHVGLFLLTTDSFEKVVEDMVIPLALRYGNDSALLKQVADDKCTLDVHLRLSVKEKDEFSKS